MYLIFFFYLYEENLFLELLILSLINSVFF